MRKDSIRGTNVFRFMGSVDLEAVRRAGKMVGPRLDADPDVDGRG